MRLFLALTLPDAALDLLSDLQDAMPEGRAVDLDALHLTLAFLGETPEAALPEIDAALRSIPAAPIALRLGGGAVFGGRMTRAVAVQAEGGAALGELHDRIRSRLHGVGVILPRRRFRPHVTLLRCRDKTSAARALAVIPARRQGPFLCDSFGLFSSVLHPDGAEHEERARYPLDADA
jgi:2'-5' RNA ligase